MTDLAQALRLQAKSNEGLGSPFTARILRLLADRLTPASPLGPRLFSWEGEIGPSHQSVPLRLLGALHALTLSGRARSLAALYPPNPEPEDEPLWRAIHDALAANAPFVDQFLDSPPQTNEIGRSAVLIAAANWLRGRFALPLRLSELGASAGLNLNWDRYALELGETRYGPAHPVLTLRPELRGAAPEVAMPLVIERRGCDLNPIDPSDPEQALRLRSYVWADQSERLGRLTRALTLPPNPVDAVEAASWLSGRLATAQPGSLHLVYNTVAWQYFPATTQAACRETLETAPATAEAPRAHLQMESDHQSPGAAVTLRLWPQREDWSLGRADFHGRWLDWRPERVA